MAGHTILLNLLGGVALLLWGTRMVQSAILKAFGPQLRTAIARAAAGPVRAAATGAAAATALQSATATAVLVTGFVTRGLIALPAALALMLGADLGTTLAVQALSLDVRALIPLLLIAGVALARASRPTTEQVGRLLVGIGLILLALGLIVSASAPMRASATVALVLGRLARRPAAGDAAGGGADLGDAFERRLRPLRDLARRRRPDRAAAGAGAGARRQRRRRPRGPRHRRRAAGGGAPRRHRQPRVPPDRRRRRVPGARPADDGGRVAGGRARPGGRAFPHALQPRPRGRVPAARRPRRGAARARAPRRRAVARRPPRPARSRPSRQPAAGAERRDPGDAAPRRQGRADAARDDPDLRGDRPAPHPRRRGDGEGGRRRAGADQALPRPAHAARPHPRRERARSSKP